MKKIVLSALIIICTITIAVLLYRLIFIRVVNYEIAGVKIPSTYNVLTNKVIPIQNYKGRSDLPVMQPSVKGNVGLTSEEADAAKIRWALFEEWVGQFPQYKAWQTDPAIFRKAMAEFRKSLGL